MINRGDIIKHKNFMDVAIRVIDISDNITTNNYEITGFWINQGQVKTFNMNLLAQISIKKDKISDWLKCSKPESNFIRNETWEQFK